MLLLRLVAGIGMVFQGATALRGSPSVGLIAVDALAALSGLLLLIGLWTPAAGVLAALVEFPAAYFRQAQDPWIYILFGILGICLALLGPGIYSIDARLFGWQRIDIPDQKN